MAIKLFFDMEFTGLHRKTTPISIGIISEYGRTFYAEFSYYDTSQVDDWIKENVISNLRFGGTMSIPKIDLEHHAMCGNMTQVTESLIEWLEQFESIEMWSDCLAYDWVLFCGLFGGALNIPKSIYYIPFDLSTAFKMKCIDPDVNREEYSEIKEGAKHNALHDAKVIRACFMKLIS